MPTTIEVNTTNAANEMIELTRVYKIDATGQVKTGPITLAANTIISVRPSNRLGKDNHRSTVTLINGDTFELSERYTEVLDLLDMAV